MADPFLAYGQPPVPSQRLKPKQPNRPENGTPEAVHRSTVFVKQVCLGGCDAAMHVCYSNECAGLHVGPVSVKQVCLGGCDAAVHVCYSNECAGLHVGPVSVKHV